MSLNPVKALQNWNHARLEQRRKGRTYPFRLGVLGIMKNEALNIEEWIAHYLWQGAGQLYLIDNGSTDASRDLVKPWIASGQLQLISLPEPGRQRAHYITAIKRLHIARDCEWLAMADIDEFWFCRDGSTLAETLAGFESQTDVIYTSWSIFGSNGHIDHPDSLRTGFTRRQNRSPARIRGNRKWICRTKALRNARNVGLHHIKNTCSGRTLTDNDTFQLNHYQIQSEAFFRASKMQRGDAANTAWDEMRTMDYFKAVDDLATVTDRTLADRVLAQSAVDDIAKSKPDSKAHNR